MATPEQQGTALDAPRSPTHRGVLVPRLPGEILGIIGLIVGEDNISSSARWVARDLSVVGHEFRAAAEVVLIDTVWVTQLNYSAILAQIHRFARTRHLVMHEYFPLEPFLSEPFPFASLVSVTGTVQNIHRLSEHTAFRPQALKLRYLRNCNIAELTALKGRPSTVTRLYIQAYAFFVSVVDVLPPSVKHFVIDPYVSVEDNIPQVVASVAFLLRSSRKLERLLVRTVCARYFSQSFTLAIQHLAESERDPRLWFDNSFHVDTDFEILRDRYRREAMNKQDIIWFTGRQLYSGSDPAASGSMQ